jgi:hypothetical protein
LIAGPAPPVAPGRFVAAAAQVLHPLPLQPFADIRLVMLQERNSAMDPKSVLVLLSAIGAVSALSTAGATGMEQHDDRLDFNADGMLRRLQDSGVDATSVEPWNGLLRARVQLGGRTVMQHFDPDTLAPAEV